MLNSVVVFCLRHGGEGTAVAIRWCDGRRVFVWRPSKGRTTAAVRLDLRRRRGNAPPQKGRFAERKGQA